MIFPYAKEIAVRNKVLLIAKAERIRGLVQGPVPVEAKNTKKETAYDHKGVKQYQEETLEGQEYAAKVLDEVINLLEGEVADGEEEDRDNSPGLNDEEVVRGR